MARKVVAAMSGGVDSSVAAALLLQQGWEVTGITFRLPVCGDGAPGDRGCCGVRGIRDARRVAGVLGIRHYALDFREEFRRTVIADFCREYRRGRTPNPCARCNDWIKFGALLRRARAIGADHVATGHYVRKQRDREGRWTLKTGNPRDDQSYFLFPLRQQQLERALFPLGDRSKDEVRRIATELGLPVHDKPGSQDLCFLPGGDYRDFLRKHCPVAFEAGPVEHVSGRTLGTHEGIGSFTVGQRRGLGIAHGEPLYVVGFRPQDRVVVVGERRHLLKRNVTVSEMNWIAPPARPDRIAGRVKIRYNHPGVDATARTVGDGRVEVRTAEPVEAPCPGQAAVLYDGETVLGGGIIENTGDAELN